MNHRSFLLFSFFLGVVGLVVIGGGIETCQGSVLGIDLGSTWFKVSIIHGTTFDLVVNTEGQRKQSTLVGFHRGERVFGRDAERLWNRDPSKIYGYTPILLGKPLNHSSITSQIFHFPYPLASSELRNSILIPYSSSSSSSSLSSSSSSSTASENTEEWLTPEELVAMILTQVKATVKESIGVEVIDCVITVPPFFTHHDRLALKNAATIAGLNVLSFLHTGGAIGLNYAISRTKEELEQNHYVLFYDMGASQTSASIAYFSHTPASAKGKKEDLVPQVQIIATAWDETLGGREFDRRLAAHLAQAASAQSGIDISQHPRALARLLTEARRVKEVLSANNEAKAMVEGLVDEFDFRHDVSRQTFEQLCADLLDRVSLPIEAALRAASLEESSLLSLEIFGGGSRVPAVQERLSRAFGGRPISKHLNSDEAAVMGAAFFAASSSFRMKTQYSLKDIYSFPISVNFTAGGRLEDKDRVTSIIRGNNRLGWKKTLSFNVSDASDIELILSYPPDSVPSGTPSPIAHYRLSGLPSSSDNETIIADPKVLLSFHLDKSGFISLSSAEVQYTTETLVPKALPKPNVTVSSQSEEQGEEQPQQDVEQKNNDQQQPEGESEGKEKEEQTEKEEHFEHVESDSSFSSSSENKEEQEQEQEEQIVELVPVVREHSKALQISLTPLGVIPMSQAEIQKGKNVLAKLEREEKLKRDTAEARNTLEAHIYDWLEKLDSEQDVRRHSTEQEQESLQQLLVEASEWLNDEGSESDLYSYRQKLNSVRIISDKITTRITERSGIDEAFEQWNATLPTLLAPIFQSFEKRNISEEDQANFWAALKEKIDDFYARIKQQQELPLYSDPIIRISEFATQTTWIERQAKTFRSKPFKVAEKPAPPPPPPPQSESSDSEQPASESSSSSSSNQEEPTTVNESEVPLTEEEIKSEQEEIID